MSRDRTCTPSGDITLAILPAEGPPSRVRRSRMGRRRALVLQAVHVLVLAHGVHRLVSGRTLSPLEPSESMETLRTGAINAGFIFFGLTIAATLVLGRFFCGWGCHLVAYQDACAWLLKRAGIKPRQFRSRLLPLAPLALALYMFVWPVVYRIAAGMGLPAPSWHLAREDFWITFPGPLIAALTFLVCGGVLVYFLGAKGYCTHACPYGGFFAPADRLAPARIRVTDACAHCGHCTAVCTSNVRVHEEVALYGMVVDPGCMKCMDCVSVCPNDALYVGFGRPALGAKPAQPRRVQSYDLTLGEELAAGGITLLAFWGFSGLYNRIPTLLALALAVLTAFVALKLRHLWTNANVRLQQFSLKRGGRMHPAGWGLAGLALAMIALSGHSLAVQYHAWRGDALARDLALPEAIWSPGFDWRTQATAVQVARAAAAQHQLRRADAWGLGGTGVVLADLVPVEVALGDVPSAERAARRLISLVDGRVAEPHRKLGLVLERAGKPSEAEAAYRAALRVDPGHAATLSDLAELLLREGRTGEAVDLARDAAPGDWQLDLALNLCGQGRMGEAQELLTRLCGVSPLEARARAQLGWILLNTGRVEAGTSQLEQAVALDPDLAAAHYNLAVGYFMSGRLADAETQARRYSTLNPADPVAFRFLAEVLTQSGKPDAAREALQQAASLEATMPPQARRP